MNAVEPRLQVVEVVKEFAQTRAVDRVSFDVAAGEFVVLLGASGSGKSTTLNLVAGLEEPSAGDIILRGRRINDIPPNRRGMAMVFQNYALYPHMTVFENLTFGLRLSHVAPDVQQQKAEATGRTLGIEALLDRRPGQLSGGQQQRVALGRALIREPEVFLLDEPLSNLDAKLRAQMRAELKRLHLELGSTTIYVTHDQVEAMTLADKIILLRNGRLIAQGSPLDLYDHPPNLYTADFLGSPPINLLRGTFEISSGRHRFLTGQGAFPLPPLPPDLPSSAVLGIRPEDIELNAEPDGPPRMRVALIESVGAEQYVHVQADQGRVTPGPVAQRAPGAAGTPVIISRRPASERWRLGDPVLVSFRTGKIHVFHQEHETSLTTI